MKLKSFYFLFALLCLYQKATAQKYLFDAHSSQATGFPTITGQIHHRAYGESILKKEQLEIQEDGKDVNFSLTPDTARLSSTKNKRILFLVENHYLPKGIPQRNFFANVISAGIDKSITPGDKFMIATFDWQRNGQYLFKEFNDFTDDTAVLRTALRKLAPRSALQNTQNASDINGALDESIKLLSPAGDSLPTAIILFSDEVDNIDETIVNLAIKNKAIQAQIPIYAISYELMSRYHQVMRDEICLPTFGRYFVSPRNDIEESAAKLKEFLAGIINDYRGTSFTFSYESQQQKNGQKLSLKFSVRNSTLSDTEIIDIPAPGLKEKISRNLLVVLLGAVAILLLITLVFLYVRQTKRKQKQQQDQLQETSSKITDQAQLIEKDKEQIKLLHEQQAGKLKEDQEKLAEERRKKEEERLIQLMLSHGVLPSLHYSYKDFSGTVQVSLPVFTIGREKSNHFYIQLETVSRKHATIFFDEAGSYSIQDNNSSNGTFVNGTKVKQAVLKSGDLIGIGDINIIFHL